jgi:hypothetical protein
MLSFLFILQARAVNAAGPLSLRRICGMRWNRSQGALDTGHVRRRTIGLS